jgi:alpha-galactosidase
VSRKRFPDGLKAVKQKLDGYGMQLGLWFGPAKAAVSNLGAREHPEWRRSWDGKVGEPQEVWETEKSYKVCMVSGYSDGFADELIRLAREVGVTYFKWDAIAQYGCNDPHHDHGGENNTPQERSDSYAFQLVQYMSRVADKVTAAVPGAIVDFDVTEAGRSIGLAFFASGKYFRINSGPYYQHHDIPIDLGRTNSNLFFYQGPARTWIARSPLTFDKWIPSTLFLTHEIHEKISATTVRGAVVIFATERGTYRYVTSHKVAADHWVSEGVTLSADTAGRASIEATFDKPGEKIVFFGVRRSTQACS